MATYTLETPRGKRLTIESDSPENATRLADQWDLEDHAVSEAKRQGVDPGMILRQMQQESGGRVDAVSPKGARGPMQLMPKTAQGLGVDPDDPYQNITGGVTYMRQQLDRYGGDQRKALAAYNAGPEAVDKYGGVPPFKETQDYVGAIAGGGQAKPKPPPMLPAPAKPKTAAAVPRRAVGDDVAVGLARGGMRGGAGVADSVVQASPLGLMNTELAGAANLALRLMGKGGVGPTPAPASTLSDLAVRTMPKPQTGAGGLAEKVGVNSISAFLPGSWAQRIANVVVPSLTQEGGERLVKALGGDENAQALGGAAGAGIGGLATGLRLPKVTKADVPGLRKAVTDAYAKVDASGFSFPKTDVAALADDFANAVKSTALSKAAKDDARSIISYTRGLASDAGLPLNQLEKLRGDIYGALVAKGGDTAKLGRAFRAKIDALIDAVPNGDVREARALKTQLVKAEQVAKKLDSAELKSSGADNAIRNKLRPLLDPDHPQYMATATPEERAALTRVVKGSPGRNLAAGIASMTDPRRIGGKLLMGVLAPGGGVGIPFTGGLSLLAPAAQLGTGLTATRMANQGARKSVQDLLRQIVETGLPPAPQSTSYAGLPGVIAPLLALPATAAAQPKPKQRRP